MRPAGKPKSFGWLGAVESVNTCHPAPSTSCHASGRASALSLSKFQIFASGVAVAVAVIVAVGVGDSFFFFGFEYAGGAVVTTATIAAAPTNAILRSHVLTVIILLPVRNEPGAPKSKGGLSS